MITAAKLRNHTVKVLAAMAKGEGVSGWHSMRKEQLVKALLKLAKEATAAGKNARRINCTKNRVASKDSAASSHDSNGRDPIGRFKPAHSSAANNCHRLMQIREKLDAAKSLAHKAEKERLEAATDLLVLTVKDPYWLHAYWELTPQSIRRAQVALGRHWHTAEPVLRLFEIGQNDTNPSTKRPVRDIVIHGGVNNWYIDVADPPRSFQMEIGYRTLAQTSRNQTQRLRKAEKFASTLNAGRINGRFLCLARSYIVSTAVKQVFDKHPHCDVESSLSARFGLGAQNTGRDHDDFSLEVDAEVVVFGVAEPGSRITLKGEPIATKDDGTFTFRFPLSDRRQVFPVVANSGDGMEQRTVVLAVERNTKVMATVLREPDR